MTFPTFVSFYTKGTGYEAEAKALAESLGRFNLPYHVEGITSRGSWQRACLYKPTYILKLLLDAKTPLVWIDADARVEQLPVLLKRDDEISFVSREKEVQTSLLRFSYTAEVLAFLARWVHACNRAWVGDQCWTDQQHFNHLWPIYRTLMTAVHLPSDYCTFPEDRFAPVIAQTQASRRLAKEAGYEPYPQAPVPARPAPAGGTCCGGRFVATGERCPACGDLMD